MWIRSKDVALVGKLWPRHYPLTYRGIFLFHCLPSLPFPPASLGLYNNNSNNSKEFALSFELRFYFLETVGRGSLPSS